MNFASLCRGAIVSIRDREGFAGTLTKREVMTEAAASHRSAGYILDTARLEKAAHHQLRKVCISVSLPSGWAWKPKDESEGKHFNASADSTDICVDEIASGGMRNAEDRRETGALVDTGVPWKQAEAQVRQERKDRDTG